MLNNYDIPLEEMFNYNQERKLNREDKSKQKKLLAFLMEKYGKKG